METTTKEIRGIAFIVPNPIGKIGGPTPEWDMERLRRQTGLKVNYGEETVQIWVYSPGETEGEWNWCCSYGKFPGLVGKKVAEPDRKRDDILMGYFTGVLPLRVLEKKMEGDELRLHCKEYNTDIILELRQLGSRYERFGRFENVLEYVKNWFN